MHRSTRLQNGLSLVLLLLTLSGCTGRSAVVSTSAVIVTPAGETEPMPHAGDSADDPAIWVNPRDPTHSTIIGTDKLGDVPIRSLIEFDAHMYDEGECAECKKGAPTENVRF